MKRAAWLLGALLVAGGARAQGSPASEPPGGARPPPPPPCTSTEHRQFDFWLGDWDVTTPDGKLAGRNQITRIAGGCALHEHWVGRGGFTGQSLNAWNPRTRRWQQTWLDSSGARLDLEGSWREGAMELEGREPNPERAGTTLRHRIRWTPNADGSVRQHWQTSEDDGRTWATAFDGRYARRP